MTLNSLPRGIPQWAGTRPAARPSHSTMRPSASAIPPHIESAVTKLLVATRQLLESLQMWSTLRMTDLEVRLDPLGV